MSLNTINITQLLNQPEDALLTEEEVAALRRVDPKTLSRERMAGTGCPYVKQGRSVRYRVGDYKAFNKANTVRSTAEADRIRRAGQAA
jgi:hypothetical protein